MKIKKQEWSRTDALTLAGLAGSFSEALRQGLAQHADVVHVSEGVVLARAGRSARELIVVVDGSVEIADASGCSRIAGPGTRIGAAELIEERAHASTVTTRSSATLVVIFGPAYRWTVRAMANDGASDDAVVAPLVRRGATPNPSGTTGQPALVT